MLEHSGRYYLGSPARRWRLKGGELVEDENGRVRRWPLSAVSEIRLSHDPAKGEPRRYRCEVAFRDGTRLVIPSTDCASALSSIDHAETYVPFVTALVRQASAANPGCRLLSGRRSSYPLQFVASGLALLVFTWGIATFAGMSDLEVASMVALAAAAFVPLAGVIVFRNWPRPFPPQAIPAGVMPTV